MTTLTFQDNAVQTVQNEINKLAYSPTFQIDYIELTVKVRRNKRFGIDLNIAYTNTNNHNDFIRTIKINFETPSYHQANIKTQRIAQGITTTKEILFGRD